MNITYYDRLMLAMSHVNLTFERRGGFLSDNDVLDIATAQACRCSYKINDKAVSERDRMITDLNNALTDNLGD
jgi:hypothetical protein